jgi:hypothetical protein
VVDELFITGNCSSQRFLDVSATIIASAQRWMLHHPP